MPQLFGMFMSAEEAGPVAESEVEVRLQKMEEMMQGLTSAVRDLKGHRTEVERLPALRKARKTTEPLPGLDPAVLESARGLGVPKEQLVRPSSAKQKRRRKKT